MLNFFKILCLFTLIAHLPAYATGFGQTTLHSQLGENLELNVQITDARDFSDDQLLFTLAGKDIYKNMKVDYQFSHAQLSMTIKRDADKNVTLIIRSAKPVHEPFLQFLIQMHSPEGKQIKEITALLELPQP